MTEPTASGGRLRAIARLIAVGLWTLTMFLAWAAGAVATLPFRRSRLRWRQWAVRTWSRGLGRIVGMRLTIVGLPPAAPFFLASNHLSYVDIFLLHGCLDGVFIAKREMRRWPVLGPLAHLMGTIWVNRESRRDAIRVLDAIDEAIARGDGVILFPEGTTSAGDALLPMKPALFDWAAREAYPVHYATITYRTAPGRMPAHVAVCWHGNAAFGAHAVQLCRQRGFEAVVEFGADPVRSTTRGELAERVQAEIASRFVPLE